MRKKSTDNNHHHHHTYDFITTVLFLIICSVSVSSDPNIYSNLEDKSSVEKTGKGEQDYKTQPTNKTQPTKKSKPKKPIPCIQKNYTQPQLTIMGIFSLGFASCFANRYCSIPGFANPGNLTIK